MLRGSLRHCCEVHILHGPKFMFPILRRVHIFLKCSFKNEVHFLNRGSLKKGVQFVHITRFTFFLTKKNKNSFVSKKKGSYFSKKGGSLS